VLGDDRHAGAHERLGERPALAVGRQARLQQRQRHLLAAAADLVLLNSGAAIYAAGRTENLRDGVELARETIASGAAATTLQEYVRISSELAPIST
jgi:anthranilate phosphoribosyltransferase